MHAHSQWRKTKNVILSNPQNDIFHYITTPQNQEYFFGQRARILNIAITRMPNG